MLVALDQWLFILQIDIHANSAHLILELKLKTQFVLQINALNGKRSKEMESAHSAHHIAEFCQMEKHAKSQFALEIM